MQHNIPTNSNPAIAALLKSPEMRSLMLERAEIAQALYREIVAKRTGRLARSARVETFIGGRRNDRWCARLIVDASYAASHEYGTDDGSGVRAGAHDLNQVLNQLGQL
ncbi:hypothetical protein GV791_14880 [Nocardia cyriacigeorgica]|uniref:Uncharacterized protein n=1 Tax=Nocardia cyriacigeorgica TaxID=135487 RepID=A0A6P1CMP7_9NOCA|nr:hypothetical protein [Nocardia cyriacigeorgica]NEW33840.1 hypothetical protein [Nocardia cyriacigeorgica]